jgi:hypothetical protein
LKACIFKQLTTDEPFIIILLFYSFRWIHANPSLTVAINIPQHHRVLSHLFSLVSIIAQLALSFDFGSSKHNIASRTSVNHVTLLGTAFANECLTSIAFEPQDHSNLSSPPSLLIIFGCQTILERKDNRSIKINQKSDN